MQKAHQTTSRRASEPASAMQAKQRK